MSKHQVTELESELNAIENESELLTSGVAIIVRDGTSRRVIEGATTQIEAFPTLFEGNYDDNFDGLSLNALAGFEMIVADESMVSGLGHLLNAHEKNEEAGVKPALIAVRYVGEGIPEAADEGIADGMLILPMQPAAIAAQLSLLLYAHRAYARRFQTAMDELRLNRRIFRSVTSGISVASASLPDLPLVYVNPAFEVMTGYSLEEVQGQNCRFLQGRERDQAAISQLRAAIAARREVSVLLKNFRKDGSMFWNELSLSPIRNREGEVTHFVGIQKDVTSRVEFEAALRESEKLAAVGRLASSIAHEINNPLESVMNLLYLGQEALALGEPSLKEAVAEAQQFLTLADKELQRVSQITAQSLRFYRQSTKPQLCEAADLIDSVLNLYEGRLANAAVQIDRRDRARSPLVCMDSEIRQVLNNLVRNAIDAMQPEGGRLIVGSRTAMDGKTGLRGVVLTVADTGSGISRQTMRDLYRPFHTTKGIAGTGLGLWISSEIVARHRGSLRVRSRQVDPRRPDLRSGTIFRMFLPAEWIAGEAR